MAVLLRTISRQFKVPLSLFGRPFSGSPMKNVMKHPRDRGGGPIDWKKFDWTSGFGLRWWLLVGVATFAGVQGIVLLAELLPYALKPSFREQYSINRSSKALSKFLNCIHFSYFTLYLNQESQTL